MTIDWLHFTPLAALAGSALIGLASTLYLLGAGRIAGIAGIVAGPLRAEATPLLFIAGLLLAPWLWRLFAPLPAVRIDVPPWAVLLAGVLVGVGVLMGNGCTNGHGVCGLARLSLRSLANVLAFIGAGVATVFVLRHLA